MNAEVPESPRSGAGPQSGFQAPPVEGFWKTTIANRQNLLGWDLFSALVLTIVGVVFVESKTLDKVLSGLMTAEFGIIGALFGVVIAGLAIIVGFLSREYSVVLMRSQGGPGAEFWPFWYVAALSALSIVASAVGLIVVEQLPCLRRTAFGVTTFLASYALLASVNLVAFVKSQGETRAYQLARSWEQDQRHGA